MSIFHSASNTVARIDNSMFAGQLIQMRDVFYGAFRYDDTSPLDPFQNPTQPQDGTITRYLGSEVSSALSMTSTRNGLRYTSQGDNVIYTGNYSFGDSAGMLTSSYGQQLDAHGTVSLGGGAADLMEVGQLPGYATIPKFSWRSFSITWIDLVSHDQMSIYGLINELIPQPVSEVPEPSTPASFGLVALLALIARRMSKRFTR